MARSILRTHGHTARRAFTLAELLAGIAACACVIVIVLPMLAGGNAASMIGQSMSNLVTLNAAHHIYAADWDGRQFTLVVDEFGLYGGSIQAYESANDEDHPPILLGWGESSSGQIAMWALYMSSGFPGNGNLLWAIHPNTRFGWSRIPNAKQFHDYVNGRFYDPTFYAPGDAAVIEVVEPLFAGPSEFMVPPGVTGAAPIYWSSYWLSPAALFNPNLLSRENGYTSPADLADGFTTPPLNAAMYPDLKTFMIEHNWVQNPPLECNPAFAPGSGTYDGCEPYYFNHGLASSPVTLFYDGHVRLLPNTEVLAAHESVRAASRDGLGLFFEPGDDGFNGAGELSADGYFNGGGFDGSIFNHHVLTIDGILGRDTITMR